VRPTKVNEVTTTPSNTNTNTNTTVQVNPTLTSIVEGRGPSFELTDRLVKRLGKQLNLGIAESNLNLKC
jgi:hypothetical protein